MTDQLPTVNEIIYQNLPLQIGPMSRFKLSHGPNPSFGSFCCPTVIAKDLINAGTPGTLKLRSAQGEVILHKIWPVKYITDGSVDRSLCQLILADDRIRWQKVYGNQDYNVYAKGGDESNLEGLNSGVEWTYTTLFTKLGSLVGQSEWTQDFDIPGVRIQRSPRNITGKGIPVSEILEQVLADSYTFLCYDSTHATPKVHIYKVGALATSAETNPITQNVDKRIKIYDERVNRAIAQAGSVVILGAQSGGNKWATIKTVDPPSAYPGTGEKQIQTAYLVDEKGVEDWATEIGGDYFSSFRGPWYGEQYAGIIPIPLSRAVMSIEWELAGCGATTTIKGFRPVREREHNDTLYKFNGYWCGGGGGDGDGFSWVRISQTLQYRFDTGEVDSETGASIIDPGISSYKGEFLPLDVAAWRPGQDYEEGNYARVNYNKYVCTEDHTSASSNSPEEDNSPWEEAALEETNLYLMAWQNPLRMDPPPEEGDDDYPDPAIHLAQSLHDLRNTGRWFLMHQIVPTVQFGSKWYIWQTVIPLASPHEETGILQYSLRWNQVDGRLMAVYK